VIRAAEAPFDLMVNSLCYGQIFEQTKSRAKTIRKSTLKIGQKMNGLAEMGLKNVPIQELHKQLPYD
jgi:hypothetical protein